MIKKLCLLINLFAHIYCDMPKELMEKQINLAIQNFTLNDLSLLSKKNFDNKPYVGQFVKTKLESTGYDSYDLRYELKKITEREQYKVNSYMTVPISTKNKAKDCNDILIFQKYSNVGLDLSNVLEFGDLRWKNIISYQYEFPTKQQRIFIKNKDKIINLFSIDKSYFNNSQINYFSKYADIIKGNSINFTTAMNFKKYDYNFEFGYSFTFKQKVKTEFKDDRLNNRDYKDIILEDLRSNKEIIAENMEVSLDDIDLYRTNNQNTLYNKLYISFIYNTKVLDNIVTICIDFSYGLIPDKEDDFNLLATLTCSF